MNRITFHLGIERYPSYTRKQRIFTYLYNFRFISRIVRNSLKRAYNLDESVAIDRGFHSDTRYLYVGKRTGLSNLWIHSPGEVIIGHDCSFSRGCLIITGSHDLIDFNLAILKTVKIEDFVWIATGSTILQGSVIGRGAVVSAFSVVNVNIPPYAIVAGNPCKIIGFRYTPEDALEFEKQHYPENERIPIEKLQKNYEKYFLNRIKEIKKFVSIT